MKKIALILGVVGIYFILNSFKSATPSSTNIMPIELEKGYVVADKNFSEITRLTKEAIALLQPSSFKPHQIGVSYLCYLRLFYI